MIGNLLLRGMIAGLIAGLLAFGFARTFGEPLVDRAIAFEEQEAAAANEPAEPELVSRKTQAGIGLLTGVVCYSVAIGGIFALVFAGLYGRTGRISPRGLSAILGVLAFLAIIVVPDLKYPPNPPAVGNPDTIGIRTGLFFIMMVVSIAAMVVAYLIRSALVARMGGWNASIVAGLCYIAFIAAVQFLLPAINEVPENFSAVTLYNFRIASVGIQAIVWAGTALIFGVMAEALMKNSGHYRNAIAAR
ncbi:CbtA family protein [Neorhizobium sp. NCHU2750]|uniref:CbtA family protein n=1 Tax=Neorhizobium sp. NCHU2750 TaxID=1825976 RepID=UPI000E72162D|nr:membrane protein [Neorhizobium sp. NCHU2750]